MKTITLNVKGMVCEGCKKRVESALKTIDGILDVSADFETGKVLVTFKESVLEKSISDKIIDLGFEVEESLT